jgi:hypothetical protein
VLSTLKHGARLHQELVEERDLDVDAADTSSSTAHPSERASAQSTPTRPNRYTLNRSEEPPSRDFRKSVEPFVEASYEPPAFR